MYSSAKAGSSNAPPPDAGKFIRIGVVALIAIVAFAIVGNQAVTLFMNHEEFSDLFTTPLYFSLVSGILLSAIALVRVNIVQRSSISWFVLRTLIGFVNRNPSGASSQLVLSLIHI